MKILTIIYNFHEHYQGENYAYHPYIQSIDEGINSQQIAKYISCSKAMPFGKCTEGSIGIKKVNKTKQYGKNWKQFLPNKLCYFYEYLLFTPQSLSFDNNAFLVLLVNGNKLINNYKSNIIALPDSRCILSDTPYTKDIKYPKSSNENQCLLYFKGDDNVIKLDWMNRRYWLGVVDNQFYFYKYKTGLDYSRLRTAQDFLLLHNGGEFKDLYTKNSFELSEISTNKALLKDQENFYIL